MILQLSLLLSALTFDQIYAATCGGGVVGDGICATAGQYCSRSGYCGSTSAYRGTCGSGNIGNGFCQNPTQCCSQYGFCGNKDAWCSAGKQTFLGYLPDAATSASTNYRVWEKTGLVRDISHIAMCFFIPNASAAFSWRNPIETTTRIFDSSTTYSATDLKGSLREMLLLKRKVRTLKVGMVLGGPGADWSNALSTATKINTAVTNVAQGVLDYGLDFVSIDWEYPNTTEVANLISFARGLRSKFDQILSQRILEFNITSATSSYGKIEFFMATSAKAFRNDIIGTNYQTLANYIDVFHLMGYDYDASPVSYHQSNLYVSTSMQAQSSGVKGLKDFVNTYKVKPAQLALSVPAYALVFKNAGDLGTTSSSTGRDAITYKDIANGTNIYGATLADVKYDSIAKAHWIYKNNNFITFDSTQAIIEKAFYIRNNSMNGLSMWQLAQDTDYGTPNSLITSFINTLGPNNHAMSRTLNWIYYPTSRFTNIAALASVDRDQVKSDASKLV